MIYDILIRPECPGDHRAVEELTFAAFENFEAAGVPKRDTPNEHFLVRLLRDDPDFVPELDLVAEYDGEIVGNIMYSKCTILRPSGQATEALVFGPVSVLPSRQKQGIGAWLIEYSLALAKRLGYKAVIITGHPDYYRRFGFVRAGRYNLTTLDGSVFDAFMALELETGFLGNEGGKWQCCKAFDTVENEAAFREFHKEFIA